MKNIISIILVSIFIISATSFTACRNTEEQKKVEVKNAMEDLLNELENIKADTTAQDIVIQ